MEPDAGLIEHVEHAGQPRTNLRGQADALRFAAGQAPRGARQRQVVEAHIA